MSRTHNVDMAMGAIRVKKVQVNLTDIIGIAPAIDPFLDRVDVVGLASPYRYRFPISRPTVAGQHAVGRRYPYPMRAALLVRPVVDKGRFLHFLVPLCVPLFRSPLLYNPGAGLSSAKKGPRTRALSGRFLLSRAIDTVLGYQRMRCDAVQVATDDCTAMWALPFSVQPTPRPASDFVAGVVQCNFR